MIRRWLEQPRQNTLIADGVIEKDLLKLKFWNHIDDILGTLFSILTNEERNDAEEYQHIW